MFSSPILLRLSAILLFLVFLRLWIFLILCSIFLIPPSPPCLWTFLVPSLLIFFTLGSLIPSDLRLALLVLCLCDFLVLTVFLVLSVCSVLPVFLRIFSFSVRFII